MESTPLGIHGEIPGLPPMPMAALYCDERALAAARVKQDVVDQLIDTLSMQEGVTELLLGGGGCGKTCIENLVVKALLVEFWGRCLVKAAPAQQGGPRHTRQDPPRCSQAGGRCCRECQWHTLSVPEQ